MIEDFFNLILINFWDLDLLLLQASLLYITTTNSLFFKSSLHFFQNSWRISNHKFNATFLNKISSQKCNSNIS